jgi:hypothetical protein
VFRKIVRLLQRIAFIGAGHVSIAALTDGLLGPALLPASHRAAPKKKAALRRPIMSAR